MRYLTYCYFCRRSTTRSRSWTHLTKTATKIPRWSCSCCVTTSLFGPVTRRAMGTSHRRVATTNLPKLKPFLNLIRTSYSLSSPVPLKCSPICPSTWIHSSMSTCPLVPRIPRFLLSFFFPSFPLSFLPFLSPSFFPSSLPFFFPFFFPSFCPSFFPSFLPSFFLAARLLS